MAAFALMLGRAFYLQGVHDDFLQARGEARFTRVIEIPASRGVITDRFGEPLAISTPVESVGASRSIVRMTDAQASALAKLLDIDVAVIRKRLSESTSDFVFLKRQLPPDQAARVLQLKIPGVLLEREYRRYYPAGEVAAHLVGFNNVDDDGQEGIELAYQEWLAGKPGSRRVIQDKRRQIIEDIESLRVPQQGRDLALSIDQKIQYLAYRELKAAVAQHKAKAGSAVVIDVQTGEVLALANLPAFNPNNRGKLTGQQTRNRAIIDLYEPGSTMKAFTIAAGLEAGIVSPESAAEVVERGIGEDRAAVAVGQAVAIVQRRGLRTADEGRVSGRRPWPVACAEYLAPDRAGDDVVWPWPVGYAAADRTCVLDLRDRWRDAADLDRARRHPTASHARDFRRDRAQGARDARTRNRPGRYRTARAGCRLPGGRQDRHRAQDRERRLRIALCRIVHRLRAGLGAAGHRGRDDR